MRQIAQATSFTGPTRAHRTIVLAALLAFVTTAAVVFALAVSNDSTTNSLANEPVSALRGDGGPEESAAAAAIGAHTEPIKPDESGIASAVSAGSEVIPAGPRPFGGAIAGS
jgi:hypothetical protein